MLRAKLSWVMLCCCAVVLCAVCSASWSPACQTYSARMTNSRRSWQQHQTRYRAPNSHAHTPSCAPKSTGWSQCILSCAVLCCALAFVESFTGSLQGPAFSEQVASLQAEVRMLKKTNQQLTEDHKVRESGQRVGISHGSTVACMRIYRLTSVRCKACCTACCKRPTSS